MKRILLATCLLVSTLTLTLSLGIPARAPVTDIHILNIGQGDSALITSPTGRRLLVDTGPDEAVLRSELQAVLPPLQKNIDVLLLTHSDRDHIGGAAMVLREFTVHLLVINQETEPKEGMTEILALAETLQIPVQHATHEQDLEIDPWMRLDILTPIKTFEADSANDHSIVFMLLLPGDKVLFTGDAEEGAESALVAAGVPLQAPWFIGGHHGSKTSTIPAFLSAVRPSTVIYQNGEGNSYGHPAKEVMDRLAASNIPVYNTSVVGRVRLQCAPEDSCTLTTQHRDDSS